MRKRDKQKRQRGIAIITTLMILSLLLALISAFLVVNRAGNKFTLGSLEKRQAEDLARTTLNYAYAHLEAGREWGAASAPPSEDYPPVGTVIRFTHTWDAANSTLLGDGIYAPSGDLTRPIGTVKMAVRNTLSLASVPDGTKAYMLSDQVPVQPRSARVEIEVKVGSVSKRMTALIRPLALSHESGSAGKNFFADVAGLMRVESNDPYVNRVRAGTDLVLPDVSDFRFLKSGVAASSGNLKAGGSNLTGASAATLAAAGDTVGGTFMPGAPAPAVQTFDPNDFSLPDDITHLEAGTWTFGDSKKTEWIEHDLDFQEYDLFGAPSGHGHTKRHQKKESAYNTLTSPTGKIYPSKEALLGSTTYDPPVGPAGFYSSEGAADSYGYGAAGATGFLDGSGSALPSEEPSDVHQLADGVKANVVTAQIAVEHGYKVDVSGDLIFTGSGTRSPELYFGYDIDAGGGANQTSLVDGLDAAKEDPATYMAAISAAGDINVTGGYVGYGSLIGGGDVTLKASSGLSVAPGLGVLVKGNNVIINPATEPEPSLPGAAVDVDYPIFNSSINSANGGDWSQYDNWLNLTGTARETLTTTLGSTSTGVSASTAWASFTAQIGDGGSLPALSGAWSGNLSVEQYVRLKTFYQTVAFGYNEGAGDPDWLDTGKLQSEALNRVTSRVTDIAQRAESYKLGMKAFLAAAPEVPEMFTEGLIFAENDLTINADGKTLKIKGSAVANNGDLLINNAAKLDLVYDRELIDSLYSGNNDKGSMDLEKVFVTLRNLSE